MVFLVLSTEIEAVQDLAVFWTWSLKLCKLLRKNRMLNEIAIFLEKENGPEAEKFRNDFCVVKLSYLVDIFEKLNILKLQLQGANIL
jgi:hypothetical protein